MDRTEDIREKIERVLLTVRNPSRYIGGELNSVVKPADEVRVRFAFCFPDTYDIGMSHIGMKILYSLKNRHLRLCPILRSRCARKAYPFTGSKRSHL